MTGLGTAPRINVLDPAFYVDPWDAYRWLRDEAPVQWDPVQKLWAISRHDDVVAIEAIASRLPAIVIGDLLGYPRELWPRVRHWSEQVMHFAGQSSPDGPPHVSPSQQ